MGYFKILYLRCRDESGSSFGAMGMRFPALFNIPGGGISLPRRRIRDKLPNVGIDHQERRRCKMPGLLKTPLLMRIKESIGVL